jgi:hypothetical protein
MLPPRLRLWLLASALASGCAFDLEEVDVDAAIPDLATADLTYADFALNPDAFGDSGAPLCPNGQPATHAGDLAEGDLSRWGAAPLEPFVVMPPTTTANADTMRFVEGGVSVRLESANDQAAVFYPVGRNAAWDLTPYRTLTFQVAAQATGWRSAGPHVLLLSDQDDYYELVPTSNRLPLNGAGFVRVDVPLAGGGGWARNEFGRPSLSNINYVALTFDGQGAGLRVWVDAVHIGPGTFLDCSP